MSEEVLNVLMESGFTKTLPNEVGFRLFRDTWLIVWGFKSRLTTNIVVSGESAEPIFLPSLSSERADITYAEKIIALKNALMAADEDDDYWEDR